MERTKVCGLRRSFGFLLQAGWYKRNFYNNSLFSFRLKMMPLFIKGLSIQNDHNAHWWHFLSAVCVKGLSRTQMCLFSEVMLAVMSQFCASYILFLRGVWEFWKPEAVPEPPERPLPLTKKPFTSKTQRLQLLPWYGGTHGKGTMKDHHHTFSI